MKLIAVPSKGKGGLNEVIEKRFGKCESITFISLGETDSTVPITSEAILSIVVLIILPL